MMAVTSEEVSSLQAISQFSGSGMVVSVHLIVPLRQSRPTPSLNREDCQPLVQRRLHYEVLQHSNKQRIVYRLDIV